MFDFFFFWVENEIFFIHCVSLNSNISFQVLVKISKEKGKKIGSGHDHQKRPLKGASLPEKVLTFQGGETCCQNESADNTSIGSKVRNPLENTTKRI